MRASISMIRSMARVFIYGLMGGSTMVVGGTVGRTGKEFIFCRMEHSVRDFGRMGSE
jgi:hypothetical protein